MRIQIDSDDVAAMIQKRKCLAREAWEIAEKEAIETARVVWGSKARCYKRYIFSGNVFSNSAYMLLEFFSSASDAVLSGGDAP